LKRFIPVIILLLLSFRGLCAGDPETSIVNLSIFFSANPCPDFKTLVIPIRRVQNLIVVEARIDTIVGNFIFDTGTPRLILNKTYFRRGLASDDQTAASIGRDAGAPVEKTSAKILAIKELYFENIPADLSDLGHIENHRGIKILGLLGVSLFTSFEVVIDLNREVIYLHRLDAAGNVPAEEQVVTTAPLLKVPINTMRNIITLETVVAGKKLNFCLDTGAETNALSNMAPGKVLQLFRVTRRMMMLGTGGSRSEVLLGTLDEMTIGAKSFKNMHTAITRLDNLGTAYGRSIDGILGNNFLVKGIISINFVKKELCLYAFAIQKP